MARQVRIIAWTKDGDPIAAWLLKANPRIWNIQSWLEKYGEIDSWRLAPSYRVGLMRPGHRCFLWVTGSSRQRMTPGIWAAGTVTAEPHVDSGGGEHWLDEIEKERRRPYVGVALYPLAEPIPRDELTGDPRFASAEVLRVPQMGSPNILSPQELQVLEEFNLSTIQPTPEQRARRQQDQTAQYASLTLFAGWVTYSIINDDVGDELHPWVTVRSGRDEHEERIARFEQLSEAIESLASAASMAGRRSPIVGGDIGVEDQEPILAVALSDGVEILVLHTAETEFSGLIRETGDYEDWDTWTDLGDAIAAVAAEEARRALESGGIRRAATPPSRRERLLSAELRELLEGIGDLVYTLADHKPNWIVGVEPQGVYLETERSKDKGSGPRLVPAWMLETAWAHLKANGELTNAYLLSSAGLNVKRSSAVCALLARFPGVEVASTKPIRLRLTGDPR
jgi:hypothetical protein